jgi:hypothetical protein
MGRISEWFWFLENPDPDYWTKLHHLTLTKPDLRRKQALLKERKNPPQLLLRTPPKGPPP